MLIMAMLAPFSETLAGKLNFLRRLPMAHIEVQIVIHHELVILPSAPEQITGIEIHNVIGEEERDMLFLPRTHQLVLFAKSEDVVPNNVLASVVLMKTSMLATIHNIVLQ